MQASLEKDEVYSQQVANKKQAKAQFLRKMHFENLSASKLKKDAVKQSEALMDQQSIKSALKNQEIEQIRKFAEHRARLDKVEQHN